MSNTTRMSLAEIEAIAYDALIAVGTSDVNARAMAVATAATEADGVASHGLAYIPIYAEHVACGKVNGTATPIMARPKPAYIHVDAQNGFAHPAIDMGFEALFDAARENGIACLTIDQSYNCGVLGYHTYRMAKAGLIGLGFTNAPASIAPSGGHKPVVGTNPFSMAVPGGDEPSIVIDQSASAIAKSEIMKHAREDKPIPVGWALDAEGRPTTDPHLALKGSMMPSGGYKGVGVAILVEVLAAALSGGNLGTEASPFSGPVGGPPATGQCFIAIDPSTGRAGFANRIATLVDNITAQEGAHLPGQGRGGKRAKAHEGIEVSNATIAKIKAIIDA